MINLEHIRKYLKHGDQLNGYDCLWIHTTYYGTVS